MKTLLTAGLLLCASAPALAAEPVYTHRSAQGTVAFEMLEPELQPTGMTIAHYRLTAVDLTTQTVKPEKVNHFEIGLKTQFLDRRLTVNLAGYWDVINDYQATVNNNAINVIRGYLANAGQVRVRGQSAA